MRMAKWALLAWAAALGLPAQQPAEFPWKRIDFLMGNWIGVAGEKDTPLGAGQGGFSFQPDLNRKVVIRRNQSTYDSGATHQDLMVIYLDGDAPRAIYFDSEGHTIRYALSFPKAETAVFESESGQPGPRYRLTYWMAGGQLNGKFEVAAPGSDYKPYLNWRSKRNP